VCCVCVCVLTSAARRLHRLLLRPSAAAPPHLRHTMPRLGSGVRSRPPLRTERQGRRRLQPTAPRPLPLLPTAAAGHPLSTVRVLLMPVEHRPPRRLINRGVLGAGSKQPGDVHTHRVQVAGEANDVAVFPLRVALVVLFLVVMHNNLCHTISGRRCPSPCRRPQIHAQTLMLQSHIDDTIILATLFMHSC